MNTEKKEMRRNFTFFKKQVIRKQTGATLLEAIAFLGIAAMVTLGAVALLSTAFSNADTEKASNELMGLRVAAKKTFANSGGYGANGDNLLITLSQTRSIPGSLAQANPGTPNVTVRNGWGGAVTMVATQNGAAFDISYSNVPRESCATLISGSGQNTWLSITLNGAVQQLPVTPANAATTCTDTNQIVFQGN